MRTAEEIYQQLRKYEKEIEGLREEGTPNIILYIIEIKLNALRWVLEIENKL